MLKGLIRRSIPARRTLIHAEALRAVDQATEWRQRLLGMSPADRGHTVLELIHAQVMAVLGHATPDAVESDRAFKDLGLDSLTARHGGGRRLAVTLVPAAKDSPPAFQYIAFSTAIA